MILLPSREGAKDVAPALRCGAYGTAVADAFAAAVAAVVAVAVAVVPSDAPLRLRRRTL